ncbi:uncharacterized protein [Littorina saxatilis]|uniref:uncharacterized protein isoform X2 n=1 Tax=Littorina saxatilis TaxID=31220 RepID=UPI0038B5BF2B
MTPVFDAVGQANRFRANNSLDGLDFTFADATDPMTSWQNPAARFQYSADGVRRLPDPCFNYLVTGQLQGRLPGDLGKLQPSANLRKSWMNNEFHMRAKENFRYWLNERPTPTQYGKYGMGSVKTVLGVGNAPRT